MKVIVRATEHCRVSPADSNIAGDADTDSQRASRRYRSEDAHSD